MLYLRRKQLDELVKHAKKELPNEACGILVGKGDRVEKIYEMTNKKRSPRRFLLDSKEQLRVMREARDLGQKMLAAYHSHPEGEAYPTQHDIEFGCYLDIPYLIVSLRDKEHPKIRLFHLKDGNIKEGEVINI